MSRGCAGKMLRYSLAAVSLLVAFEGPFGDAYALPSSSSTQILTGPTHPVFAPSSFWYAKIPANAPLHPNSAGFLKDFLRQFNTYYGNVAINTSSYSSPIYVVDARVPTVRVKHWDCQNRGFIDQPLQAQWQAVPIPRYAEAANGTDAQMTIYQPSTDTMWEFWKARKTEQGKWEACWGGRMDGVSKDDGIWTNPYGTTATGLPFLGGQISVEELRRGHIPHAIGIALVQYRNLENLFLARQSIGWL